MINEREPVQSSTNCPPHYWRIVSPDILPADSDFLPGSCKKCGSERDFLKDFTFNQYPVWNKETRLQPPYKGEDTFSQ